MVELVAAIPALVIFCLVMGLVFFVAHRRDAEFNKLIKGAASELGFWCISDGRELERLMKQISGFQLFQCLGADKTEVLCQKNHRNIHMYLMSLAALSPSINGSYTYRHLAVWIRKPGMALPDFWLRVRGDNVDEWMNRRFYSPTPVINLPGPLAPLSHCYALTGSPADEVVHLLGGVVGQYLAILAAQSIYHSLEGAGDDLLQYIPIDESIDTANIHAFIWETVHVLEKIELQS